MSDQIKIAHRFTYYPTRSAVAHQVMCVGCPESVGLVAGQMERSRTLRSFKTAP